MYHPSSILHKTSYLHGKYDDCASYPPVLSYKSYKYTHVSDPSYLIKYHPSYIYIYVCIYKNTYSFKVSKQNKKIIHQIWKKQSPGRKPRWTHRIFPGERKQHSLQYLWKFFWLEAILKSPRNKYKWFVFLEFLVSFVKMTSFSGVKNHFVRFFQWKISTTIPYLHSSVLSVRTGEWGLKKPILDRLMPSCPKQPPDHDSQVHDTYITMT